jgi:outer membrane protein OmpA-like peptidoglycan-associated protein
MNKYSMKKVFTACLIIGILILFLISSFSCAHKRLSPQWKLFMDLSQLENKAVVLSRDFPDSVRIIYAWDYDEAPDHRHLLLWEEVDGTIYPVNGMSIRSFRLKSGSSVVFVIDESASMTDYSVYVDTVLVKLCSLVPAESLSVIRFGGNVTTMKGFYTPERLIDQMKIFSAKPNPDGSMVIPAIEKAAELLATQSTTQKVIILITDDSFSLETKLSELTSLISSEDIKICVLSTGSFEYPLWQKIASKTGGVFIPSFQKIGDTDVLLSFLRYSQEIAYIPPVRDEDGAIHQIIASFSNPPVKRYGSYKVKGARGTSQIASSLKDKRQNEITEEKKPKTRPIPQILLMGLRIPFKDIGSYRITGEVEDALDSLIFALGALDPSVKYTLDISGHTCDIGSEGFNTDLSKKRAKSVLDYISDRAGGNITMTISAKGSGNPIRPNTTEDNRSLNRRVDINFIPRNIEQTKIVPVDNDPVDTIIR